MNGGAVSRASKQIAVIVTGAVLSALVVTYLRREYPEYFGGAHG